jgi:hypothetical protein
LCLLKSRYPSKYDPKNIPLKQARSDAGGLSKNMLPEFVKELSKKCVVS